MKPIELNRDQKDKIVEMSKILFPGYKYIGFYSLQSHTLQVSKTKDDLILIHWFEFLITKLAYELFLKIGFDIGDYSDFIQGLAYNMKYEDVNPIDYLYGQFKQLK